MSESKPDHVLVHALLTASGVCGGVWQKDSGRWLVSPGLLTTLGYPGKWTTWSESEWCELANPEDRGGFLALLDDLKHNRPVIEHHVRLKSHHGAWLRFACRGQDDASGPLVLLRDVTTQSQIESALHDSQMRLNSLSDSAPIAIILWSKEGRITNWNEMASQTFGFARDRVVGQKLVPLLIHPDDYRLFSDAISRSVAENSAHEVICRTLSNSGMPLQCRWRSVPLRTRKGALTGIFSLAQDVTAELAAAESLRQGKLAAERLSDAKSEFMAVVGHELRTPLNGVLGIAQLLETYDLDSEVMELVKKICDSGDHLLQIITAIMRYAEADRTGSHEMLHIFSPMELFYLGAQVHEFRAKKKGLGFAVELDANLPDLVEADEESLRVIVDTLLDNAVKFTDCGDIRLIVRVMGKEASRLDLEISVIDSGIGMSEQFLEHLYEPFHQAENAILRKHGGVGLGLPLAGKLIARMGGEIKVDSRPGQGTAFVVYCPVSFLD